MTPIKSHRRPAFIAGLLMMCGCQTALDGRSALVPLASSPSTDTEDMILAAVFGPEQREPTTQPVPETSRPTTRPVRKPGYTAPPMAVRDVRFLEVSFVPGRLGRDTSEARQFSESQVPAQAGAAQRGLGGLPGLTAPQPVTAGAILGLPGLQVGRSAGLSPGSQVNTIFLPRANPLTRGCQDLAHVGFFGGNADSCLTRFRH